MLPFLAALFGGAAAPAATAATAAAAPVAAGLSAAAPAAAGLATAAPAAAAPAAGLSAGAIEAATAAVPSATAVTDAVKTASAMGRGTPPMWWQKGSTWLDKNLGTDFMSMAGSPLKDRLATSAKLMKVGQGLSGGGGAPSASGNSDYQAQMARLAELIAASRQRRQ